MPTPFPKISTLCVLPRPPGISSVFSARRRLQVAGVDRQPRRGPAGSTSDRGSRGSSGPRLRAAMRTLVKSTCAVMSRSPASSSHAGASAGRSGPAIVWRANVVSVPPACVDRVQLARLVPVVDDDDEAARQPAGGRCDPVDRAEVDLAAPARLERRRRGDRDTPRAPASTAGLRPFAAAPPRRAVDVDLAQAVAAHHDLMDRQRVEQLVGEQDAFEGRRQVRRGRGRAARHRRRARRAARRARRRWPRRGGGGCDRRTRDRGVAPRAGCRRTAGRCRRRPRRDRRVRGRSVGISALRVYVARMSAISASWTSSSSPNTGPTSTLVKKSPARPDRWAARA